MERVGLRKELIGKRSFAALDDTDRVLVTGGSGWLGRELVARLRGSRPEIPVLAVANGARSLDLGGTQVGVVAWDRERIRAWNPTILVHLAYVTREMEEVLGTTEYEAQNLRLSEQALDLHSIPTLRGIVVASSGAAITMKESPYGRLKFRDELQFIEAGYETGIPTVVARIWSVSGAHCTKRERFAFYDLIHQVQNKPVITIQSPHEVWRRYVDAGEYLEICLCAAAAGVSEVIESAGDLVEIEDLAIRIQTVFGLTKPIERPSRFGTPDCYYSDSATMRMWAHEFRVPISPLERQICTSATMRE